MSKQAQQTQYKPKRVDVFDMRKGTDKNGKEFRRVVFAKGIEITYNGYVVDLGEYNSVFLKSGPEMQKDLDFLLENDHLTKDKYDEQVARIEEKNIVGKVTIDLK